ncbi:hypothetical protein C8Q80DRAFT_1109851 [Daedaleopsis nitida]|nr:hypothetical protein C8Q80DRAFT_1109851 [Daedaleopsis nitida]
MTSLDYGNLATPDDLAIFPNASSFVVGRPYTDSESRGVLVLVIVSCISATAVTGLLLDIAVSAFNTRKSTSSNLFVRSHVVTYFVSLLLCELAQTIGSIMSMRWVNEKAVSYEPYCTAQGAVKQVSDVGTAFWYIIALNTFWILFLRWKLKPHVVVAALVGGWCSVGALVSAGPIAINQVSNGPFYAISGYWCWISDHYPSERITYVCMFLSAILCFIMYTLVFLNLRGNVFVNGWRLTVRFHRDHAETASKSVDTHVVNIAKGMLLYVPYIVAYTILLLPIAICRFAEWTGHEVPFAATIFSDAIFLLSGFVNVVLFITTRRVLPMHSVIPRGVSQIFSRSSMAASSRGSAYTTSSYATDLEKTTLSDEQSVHTRFSGAPVSALPSVAPTPYVTASPAPSAPPSAACTQYATSPAFSIGFGQSEKFDMINIASAGPERRTFVQEVDITNSSSPYSPDYWLSPAARSHALSVHIPSSAFSPSFPRRSAGDRTSRAHSSPSGGTFRR